MPALSPVGRGGRMRASVSPRMSESQPVQHTAIHAAHSSAAARFPRPIVFPPLPQVPPPGLPAFVFIISFSARLDQFQNCKYFSRYTRKAEGRA